MRLEEGGLDNRVESERLTSEAWWAIYGKFKSLPFQYYSTYFQPFQVEEEGVTGDLADDLTDIYADLKAGLHLHDSGHVVAAIGEWRALFSIHWGRHAVSALHALHCYIVDEETA